MNAFFSSDGKNVIFEKKDKSLNIIGFENLSLDRFGIEGFTVPKTAGINGYKPEVEFSDCRIPVWRDPITLLKVHNSELSDHIFMSPDKRFTANNNYTVTKVSHLLEFPLSAGGSKRSILRKPLSMGI